MRKTLSLAIIAKNEEENLRACLDSVVRYVDEVVVVDTGSTDGTRGVATSFGASVIDFSPRTHPDAFFRDDEETCRKFGYDIPNSYSNEVVFADFSAARNVSFDHCTSDFVLWVDSDDVVEGAEHLPEIVADLESRGLHLGFLAYDYARDHLGRVFYRQWRERVVRRGIARWVNDVHEVLLPSVPIIPVRYDKVNISHRRKLDRPGLPNRNYKLLLRMLAREHARNPSAPPDPRTLFYLGQESRYIEPVRSVGFYENYVKLSGWNEERAAAHIALGDIYEFGRIPGMPPTEACSRANREYATAAMEMPNNPDGLFGAARIAHLRERWSDCVALSERALAIGNTDSLLGANPMDRLYRPHVYYNHALAKLGRVEEALASCVAGLKVCPDDPGIPGGASGMLTYNLRLYEQELEHRRNAQKPPAAAPERTALVEFDRNEDVDAPPVEGIPRDAMVIWAMQLWKQLRAGGAPYEQLCAFLQSLPAGIQNDEAVQRMHASTARSFKAPATSKGPPWQEVSSVSIKSGAQRAGAWLPQSVSPPHVVFYVGGAFQPWDPTTPETTGIGGSETACIEMARELSRLGCRVTVYGDLGKPGSTEYFGVNNRPGGSIQYHHNDLFHDVVCDVFISSRRPDIIDATIQAKLKLLWVHDVTVGPPAAQMEKWLLKFDRILCLSNWHKEFFLSQYPTLHPSRVIVTRNGIDPARFAAEPVKQGNRLVFSSSPNRGLDTLLANFPFIREQVPDAQLDICYGFEAWETFARLRGATSELAEIERYRGMIKNAVDRGWAVYHGRVPQKRLAEIMLAAKVWAYPTGFPETSCITAMETQAAGCVPVTSKFAALAETVKHGWLIEMGPNYGPQWLAAVVGMLTNDNAREEIARAGRAYALANLSWNTLAGEWLTMFEQLLVELRANPVPPWKDAA